MVALKLDPEDGSVVWRWKDKVDGFGSFVGAAADAEGSVILTARTSQESSDDDYIALKLDPDGSVLWRLEDAGEYVAAGPEGSVIMSGGDFGDFSLAKLDASGNLSWHWTVESDSCYTGNALAMTDDDAEVIAGTTSCSAAEMSAGGDDFVAFKVDMDGNEIWRWQDGTEHRDTIYSAVAAEDGSVILSGSTDGSFARSNQMGYDMVAIKLDTNGDEVWRWQGGTAAVDKTLSSAIGADGSLIMTGLTSGDWRRPNLGIYDFMAVKINGLDGSPDDWGWQDGTAGADRIRGMASVSSDCFIFIGDTNGSFGRNHTSDGVEAVAVLVNSTTSDAAPDESTPDEEEHIPGSSCSTLLVAGGIVIVVVALFVLFVRPLFEQRRQIRSRSGQRRQIRSRVRDPRTNGRAEVNDASTLVDVFLDPREFARDESHTRRPSPDTSGSP